MASRYELLRKSVEQFYVKGSPLLIDASALSRDTQTGKILAQVKFVNLDSREVAAVVVDFEARDVTGALLEGITGYQYLDLEAESGCDFGSRTPVIFPDCNTRYFKVTIRRAVFSDGSRWDAPNGITWKALPAQEDLESVLGSKEYVEQYKRDTSVFSVNAPLEYEDLWICACEVVNKSTNATCAACGQSRADMFEALRRDYLAAGLAEYIEKEKAGEKRRKRRIIAITGILAFVIGAVLIVTPIVRPEIERMRAEAARAAIEAADREVLASLSSLGQGDTFSYKDFHWVVLQAQKDKVLVLSETSTGAHFFQNSDALSGDEITWENSDIRKWLNGDYFDTLPLEINEIVMEATIDNSHSLWGGSSFPARTQAPDTVDKVFLLSEGELFGRGARAGYLKSEKLVRWFRDSGFEGWLRTTVFQEIGNGVQIRRAGVANFNSASEVNSASEPVFFYVDSLREVYPAMWLSTK